MNAILKRFVFTFAVVVAIAPTIYAAEADDDIAFEASVMVPMRDGVRLATDVYRPAKAGKPVDEKLPTILIRTPYGKGDKPLSSSEGRYFARHGYNVVVQDTRGRYRSEGVWRLLNDDGPDGVDAAAWIGKQPWSNGKLGMLGTSYVGGTQHALALEKCPELVTVIPVDAVSNMGYASMRNSGAFELRFWNWIMLNAGRGSRAAKDPGTAAALKEMAEHRHDYLQQLPLRYGTTPLKLAPEYEDWLIQAMRNGENGAFWRHVNITDFSARYKDMPVYLVGGWYDSWAANTTSNYRVLSKQLKSPVYLIMGPWIHGQQGASAHGQVSFGREAAIADPLAWRLAWYDHWLKGVENSVGRDEPFRSRVRVFVMGTGDGKKTDDGRLNHGGSWRDEEDWPLKRAKPVNYFLQPEGKLSTSAPRGNGGATSFLFDPKNPVPTIGGNISSGDGIMLQGGWDQRGGKHVWNFQEPIPLSARNDVLVFQTEPLEQDVEVTGELEVKLWVSSTVFDTDFTAKLIDVYPPSEDFPGGFDLNIVDGILRMRFRDSLREESTAPLRRLEVYPITIRLYPTSNVFKKGHRIRVDVSSSNYPRFDVNPNTGEPLNEQRSLIEAMNRVHHNRAEPSHIVLPVVESN
ncbi:MAG: CocE/NonD family hydrolase [Planctomycetes bacterium]|nr:CocE/NonD family hydrolase [Planctomycetota bacterium]